MDYAKERDRVLDEACFRLLWCTSSREVREAYEDERDNGVPVYDLYVTYTGHYCHGPGCSQPIASHPLRPRTKQVRSFYCSVACYRRARYHDAHPDVVALGPRAVRAQRTAVFGTALGARALADVS